MNFRVHFEDGAKLNVEADTAKAAGDAARARHPLGPNTGKTAIIRKIKLVREK